jgi:L-threonylcarbamoyladenylate synthase
MGKRVGLLVTEENRDRYGVGNVIVMGSIKDKRTIAHGLFHAIRRLDELEIDIILCESVEEDQIGMAIMNRLLKAAGGNRVNL